MNVENAKSQMRKGMLEYCILLLLRAEASYANDIIEKLKGKITIILTTHYMEEAEALSDRIGIMKNGRVIVTGTAKSLMEQAEVSTFEDAFVRIVTGEEL